MYRVIVVSRSEGFDVSFVYDVCHLFWGNFSSLLKKLVTLPSAARRVGDLRHTSLLSLFLRGQVNCNRARLTYPFQLLEVFPQEGDRVLGPAHAQLHYTVFQDLLDIMSLHVFLALA